MGRMLSNLSVPWWALVIMIAGLAGFAAMVVTSLVKNRGVKRSLFAAPYGLWMVIFTVLPILIIGYYALTDSQGRFTTDNVALFWDSNYLKRIEAENDYNTRAGNMDGTIAAKEEEIAAKEEEVAAKQAQLDEERVKKGVPELEGRIAQSEARLYALKLELNALETAEPRDAEAAAAKQAEVADCEAETNALKAELDNKLKKGNLKKLTTQMNTLQADLGELQEELRTLREEGLHPYVPLPRGTLNTDAFLLSLWLAFLCTGICLILGYPAALFMANRKMKRASSLLILFVVPMWMNITLRTLAMRVLIQDDGLVLSAMNWFRGIFGLAPMRLNDTIEAVLIAMVYNFLPFMIFPIYTVLSKLDPAYSEASADLGAAPARTFAKVTLPLSVPGIVSGVTMVFMPSVTTFAINDILGGSMRDMLGNKIERVFMTDNNWYLGSAISMVMMVLILLSLTILRKADPNNEGGGM